MIPPAVCSWCDEPFLKAAPIVMLVPSDGYVRIFHNACQLELIDELFARENASIFRKKDRATKGS